MEKRDAVESTNEWEKFMEKVHKSNAEFAKGIVGDATISSWSHSNDVTIFGGYGGFVEPGWENVKARLEAAAGKANNGRYSYQTIKNSFTDRSAYILQTEQYEFPENLVIDLRVTIICQKEPDGWKIVHRHGEIVKKI